MNVNKVAFGLILGVAVTLLITEFQFIKKSYNQLTEKSDDAYYEKGERSIVDCPGLGYITSPKGGDAVVFKCDWRSHKTWDMITDTTLTPTEELLGLSANPYKNRKTLAVVKKYLGNDKWRMIEVWESDLNELADHGGSCWYSKMGGCPHHELVWKR